jgi:hypothetical protein
MLFSAKERSTEGHFKLKITSLSSSKVLILGKMVLSKGLLTLIVDEICSVCRAKPI